MINIEHNFFEKNIQKDFKLYYSTKVEYISALSRIPLRFVQLYGPKGQSNHIVTNLSCQGAIKNYMGTLFLFLSL